MYVQTWSLHKYKFVHTLILYMVLLLVLHVGRDKSRTGRDWSRLVIWKHTVKKNLQPALTFLARSGLSGIFPQNRHITDHFVTKNQLYT